MAAEAKVHGAPIPMFSSDLDNFHYQYTGRLSQNGKLVRERTWIDTIPRDNQ